MDFLEQYLDRANKVIGDRTREEEGYDREVLRWLRKGKDIQKALRKANQKYPEEALEISDDSIKDVAAHYDYLLEHDNIIRRISH